MKIYTKTGDDGTTGLFGGGRVSKGELRVEAYGAVDELNSQLGLVRAESDDHAMDALLARAQRDLFVMGADLATPEDAKAAAKIRRLAPEDARWLEEAIDRLDGEIAPLRNFILPGGAPEAARLHLARAVCRRAERAVVRLAAEESVSPGVVVYLNRLSDFLFTAGRAANARAGRAEEPWQG